MTSTNPATKRGGKDPFVGHQLAFLNARATQYQQVLDAKTSNNFYDQVTPDFIKKYGESEPFHVALAEDVEPMEIEVDDDTSAPTAAQVLISQ